MNDNTHERVEVEDLESHPELEWAKLSDLEVGEAYTLGVESPLTFLMLGKFYGRNGRPEYDVTTLVGAAGGRASTKTFFRGELEVLVVPPEEIGKRIATAAEAFSSRSFAGSERIELDRGCWPLSLLADDLEVVA